VVVVHHAASRFTLLKSHHRLGSLWRRLLNRRFACDPRAHDEAVAARHDLPLKSFQLGESTEAQSRIAVKNV
jgi:hypothetical protein